jgi:thiamine-phosphate pyrophosphorylase
MAIVDGDAARRGGWTMVDLAAAYLDGGATLLQLRAKHASSGAMLETAAAMASRAHAAGALLIVNDRADVARLSGADGVHVGQDDLPPALARRVLSPDALVGVSTHTLEQVDAAVKEAAGAVSYVAIGPVFETASKATGYDRVGLEMVRRAAGRVREHDVPLVAIGGITLDTAPQVIEAGAASVAVIGDLVATGDPAARVRAYLERLTV